MQEEETEKRPGDIEIEQAVCETTNIYKRSGKYQGCKLCAYKRLNL